MAKTIKAIICPNCGSNQKTEIKPDYFVCESCQTEYYLDSDDIHIIHTNNPAQKSPAPQNPNFSKNARIFGLVLSFLVLFLLFSNVFSSSSNSSTIPTASAQADLDDEEMVVSATKNNELLFVTVGIERTGNYENRKEKAVVYYDNPEGKNVKKQELNLSIPKNKASSPFEIKYFSNGDCYIIFNYKKVYKLNPDAMNLKEVSQDLFHASEFANGIAKIEKDYAEDAFKIQTLDGKLFYYFPIIDQVITTEEYYQKERKIPARAINTTDYQLMTNTSNSSSKLIKYVRLKEDGYPASEVYFDEKDDKIVVRYRTANFVSFEPFLPDRIFFDAKIIGEDKEQLIIRFTIDGAPNSSNQIQALDKETGKIRWSFDCSPLDRHVKYYPSKALSNSKITLIVANFGGLVIDNKTGKLIKSIEGR